MTHLTRKIEQRYVDMSQSEKELATYFLNNMQTLPFETAVTIAGHVGVSQMTVIRFIRSLGYQNLRQLKDELRSATSRQHIDNVLDRHKLQGHYSQTLKDTLDLEIKSLLEAYSQAVGKKWTDIIDILATSKNIYVLGFQTSKGLALDFSTRLQYVRKGVLFIENTSGIYLDVLGEQADDSCVVLIDTVAYSTDSFKLAEVCRRMRFPLIVIMDRFSHWPYEYTRHVIQVSTHVRMFWDSTVGLAAVSNLLINSLAARVGKEAERRYKQTEELNRIFDAFSEGPPTKPR